MDMEKRLVVKGGELRDYPGYYKIEGRIEGETDSWEYVRKSDGTWWEIAQKDLFPRSGGSLSVTLGEQVTNQKILSVCKEHYIRLTTEALKQ